MLANLKIENVAVIEKAEVTFTPGLNVLTGETGAGKSILIDSINAILGNRTSRDLVRSGAQKACIWATFESVPPSVQEKMEKSGEIREKKGRVILATVKGDIHDIGKNIVKVLLENYSFDVIDLGKDVSPEKIVETACEKQVPLVGLSALMTTTVVSMEETIKMLREKKPDCKVMVGGAVLNQEYADMIGADFYGKDAMQSVHYAEKIFKDALQKSADKKE